MDACNGGDALVFQVFIIGDSGVGKSCLLQRFAEGTYEEIFTPTTGVKFRTWTIPVDGKTIRLQINDVAGNGDYRPAIWNKYKKAHGFIIVFDVTDEELANKWAIKFMEASAKDGTNVGHIFVGMALDIKKRLYPQLKGSPMDAEHVDISPGHQKISANTTDSVGSQRNEKGNMDGSRPAGSAASRPQGKSRREPCDYTFNVALIGDSGVGKSCLMLRFTDDCFSHLTAATVCLDMRTKVLKVDGHTVELLIRDTAGQEIHRAITRSYYRGSDGIIIVYDVTRKETFDSIQSWLEDIDTYAREDTIKILVGNKNDMTKEKVVDHSFAQGFADQHGLPFLEASARNATNVEKIFETIATLLKERAGPPKKRDNKGDQTDTVQLDSEKKPKKRSGCC
ncbi:ras-related protein ORAB-1-like isoform X2 [Haemaphysalis longicornis]